MSPRPAPRWLVYLAFLGLLALLILACAIAGATAAGSHIPGY